MKKHFFITGLTLLSGFTYVNLFLGEQMGLNSLLFTIALLSAILGFQPKLRTSPSALLAAGGVFLTALIVVWHNSAFAKVMHWISLLLLIGYAQRRELRFVVFAGMLAISSLLTLPQQWLKELRQAILPKAHYRFPLQKIPLMILPIFCLTIFGGIYYEANQKWADLFDRFWASFLNIFHWNFSIEQVLLFGLGFWLMGAGILRSRFGELFTHVENYLGDQLTRHRIPLKDRWWPHTNMLSLKNEYWVAILTIGLLNILLFVVNMTDLRYVWVETEMTTAAELSQYVHEGTYLLILSILLSAGILIYFFRGNQNFYKKNTLLHEMTYVWIAQNAMLALSVGMRNYRYFSEFGLAYKRIGVFVFLMLVLAGLWVLYLKIRDKKTTFFLLRTNGWIFYLVLVLFSALNWDVIITKYNIYQAANTDRVLDDYFLTQEVGTGNLLVLENQKAQIRKLVSDPEEFDEALDRKKATFLRQQDRLSWKSWNWAGARMERELTALR